MKNKVPIILMILLLGVLTVGAVWKFPKGDVQKPLVTNFEECVTAGNPVMESYPRQCRNGEQSFTENIGNELKKDNLIRVEYPRPNQIITSPLVIKGTARGSWFFEASFPIVLTDWDGKIIAQGVATAKGEWMTTEFVPYEATLAYTIDKNMYSNKGTLVLRKDNPSGLLEHDDALEIPVVFAKSTGGSGGILPYDSGIQGTIMAGPTCPVMQNPPDPKCNDKPVRTNVSVYRASDTSRSVAMLESGENGIFKVSLSPGEYVVMAGPYGVPLPRCADATAKVVAGGYTQITVACDTGIR